MRAVFIDGGLPPQGAKTIHMNMATASVAMAQELAAHHKARGVPYLAACVWGRPDAAAAAKLSVVVAGEKTAIDKVEPLFKVLAQRHTRVGDDPVMANVAKIAGNLMVASAIEAMGEAAALVRAYGLNGADFLTMVNTALFDVPVYRGYGDAIGNSKYEPPGFDLALASRTCGWRSRPARRRTCRCHLPMCCATRSSTRSRMATARRIGRLLRQWRRDGPGWIRPLSSSPGIRPCARAP